MCRSCNQKGHVEKVCKRKQQEAQIARETDDEKEEHLFVATCFASNIASETWLIDSGCTHHMTHDKDMFVKMDKTHFSKVRIGNGDYIEVKDIGDIAIDFGSGKRIISYVLYVSEIDKNLLSVIQLLEKDYVVVFKDKTCEVFDSTDIKLMSIKMNGKSFSTNIQTDLAYSYAAKVGNWEKAKAVEKVKKKKRMKKRLERRPRLDEKGVSTVNIEDLDDDWLPPPPESAGNAQSLIDEDSTLKKLRLKKQELTSFTETTKQLLKDVEESSKFEINDSLPVDGVGEKSPNHSERPKIATSFKTRMEKRRFECLRMTSLKGLSKHMQIKSSVTRNE